MLIFKLLWKKLWGFGLSVLDATVKSLDRPLQVNIDIPFSYTGFSQIPMAMILKRNVFTDNSTIGDLIFDGAFQCYTLELSARKRAGVKTCIPAGIYEVTMQWSTRFKMDTPHLQNVPGRAFIEIHPGNKPQDTEGCILVGETMDTDWVGQSRNAYKALILKIESKIKAGNKLYIEVTGSA